jgi:uncharacterized coiled-coil DUF342 family protein
LPRFLSVSVSLFFHFLLSLFIARAYGTHVPLSLTPSIFTRAHTAARIAVRFLLPQGSLEASKSATEEQLEALRLAHAELQGKVAEANELAAGKESSLRDALERTAALERQHALLNAEFTEYKTKASQVLQRKEKLISDLQSGGGSSGWSGAGGAGGSGDGGGDVAQLRDERDALRRELAETNNALQQLRADVREIEQQQDDDNELAAGQIRELEKALGSARAAQVSHTWFVVGGAPLTLTPLFFTAFITSILSFRQCRKYLCTRTRLVFSQNYQQTNPRALTFHTQAALEQETSQRLRELTEQLEDATRKKDLLSHETERSAAELHHLHSEVARLSGTSVGRATAELEEKVPFTSRLSLTRSNAINTARHATHARTRQ